MPGLRFATQHKAAVAITAIDETCMRVHRQVNDRMAHRAAHAIAGDVIRIDGDDFRRQAIGGDWLDVTTMWGNDAFFSFVWRGQTDGWCMCIAHVLKLLLCRPFRKPLTLEFGQLFHQERRQFRQHGRAEIELDPGCLV